jgi:hypothetical protein
MKLYNLFNEVIFEEIQKHKQLLTESASDNDIINAIDSKYYVNIMYQGEKDKMPRKRHIQIYVLGDTLANNRAIRAYCFNTNEPGWKLYLTDNISGLQITKKKWQNPVSDFSIYVQTYNQLGDKSMSRLIHQIDPRTFTKQRSDISQKPNTTPNNVVDKQTNNVSQKPTIPTNDTVDKQINNVNQNQQLSNDNEEEEELNK